MISSCSFERKFLIELYIDMLLLIQVVLTCIFINEKANVDHYITLGPLVYLLYACLNLMFSYMVLRPHRKRMNVLRVAIIYRIIGLLGIIILTVLEEFNLNEFIAVMAFLEVLVIPAWIWIYKEIKRQSQYEVINPDSEEQSNNEV